MIRAGQLLSWLRTFGSLWKRMQSSWMRLWTTRETLATTTLVSRPLRNPISFEWMERVWNDHSTWSCALHVASIVAIWPRHWKPMTSCPRSSSHMLLQPSSTRAHPSHRCLPAFSWRWRRTALRESMTPWSSVPWSQSQLEGLELPSPTSVPVHPTSVVPMGTATGLFPCCGISMRLPVMWIRVVASERDPLPCTWSHGMQMSMTSLSSARTMERRSRELEIFSWVFGSQISSWNEWKKTWTGHCFVPMRPTTLRLAKAWWICGVRSSRRSTPSWKLMEKAERPWGPRTCGSESLRLRWKLELPTCCTKITAIGSPTSKISAPFTAPIFAQRSLSTLLQMKSQFATLHPLHCRPLLAQKEKHMTFRSSMKWPRWSQRIWTKSLTATITPWKKPVAPTCVIVLWVWVFKVLQMPSWWWSCPLRVTKQESSTKTFSRPSTLLHARLLANWRKSMGHMRPMQAAQPAKVSCNSISGVAFLAVDAGIGRVWRLGEQGERGERDDSNWLESIWFQLYIILY